MTDESQSLDSMLNDEPQEAVEVQEAEAVSEPPEQTETAAEKRSRDEQGRFAAKTGVDEAVPPTDKLPQEDYKAIREEREKRQKLELELEALRNQINQRPQEPPPSLWDDDQAWQQHFGGQVVSAAVQQATFKSKLDMSEMMARQANPDFNEAWEPMNEFLNQNPQLAQQAIESAHPWDMAYKAFKNNKTMSELGAVDVADLEAKLREQIMAEMQQSSAPAMQQSVPPSITGQRNVGARTGPTWSGPKSLSDMLG